MAASAGSGLGMGTLAAGVAVAAVVGVVGYQVIFAPGPNPDVPDAPQGIAGDVAPVVDAPVVADESVEVAADTPAPTTPEDPAPAPDLIAPRFDLVRVDAAGGALIAGQAEGNASLRLLLDGQEIHLADSDAGGEFVAMFDIPPSELPRVLSLEMLMADGSVLVSEQSVIISPTLRPVEPVPGTAIAEADPSGPDVPSDSGVTELAVASQPDTPPVSGAAPIAPNPPELPSEGSTAAGGSDPEADVPQVEGLLAGSADEPPSVGTEIASATVAEESSEAEAESPVLEIASADLPEATGEGLNRGLQPGTGSPDGTDTREETEEEVGSAIVSDDPSDSAGPAPEAGNIVVNDDPAGTEDTTSVVSDDPAAGSEAPEIVIAEVTESPATPVATSDPEVEDTASQVATLPSETDETDAPTAEIAAESGTPGVEESVTELAMADTTGSETAIAEDAPVTAGDAPAEPDRPQPDTSPQVEVAPQPDVATEDGTATEIADGNSSPEADNDAPEMEAQTPTVLLADSQGIRVIQSGDAAPQVQSQVTLDTIAYDTVGDVVLAGRGPAESDVRFYLNNQPIHLAPIDLQGGWRTALPQVDPGTYTLRLDEVSADGSVQSRIETPFLREEPEAVAAITSSSGENVITVQWGHTLWGIAQQHLGEGVMYVQIYEANRDQIRNPDLIYPGQIFTIPGAD